MARPKRELRVLDQEKIRTEIYRLSRDPFRDVLSFFIASAPSPQAIRKQAQRFPDRWAQSITQLANLSGYSQLNTNLDISLSASISHMSDAEIDKRIDEIQTAPPRHVEQEVIDVAPIPAVKDTDQPSATSDSQENLSAGNSATSTVSPAPSQETSDPPHPDPTPSSPLFLYTPPHQKQAPPSEKTCGGDEQEGTARYRIGPRV